ncbi:MAG: glycerophosphodiester phosphodiesterase [Betaproteobacteria bacterium]|nr:glycerophosphodiester phosphodiesterase [Betaproteobacteria bacterium]
MRLLALLILLLAAGAAMAQQPGFDLQGHRGARGLAPENTLTAFNRALDIGVTTLELDIGITRDREVVIHHDERLNPAITRDAAGAWIASPGPRIRDLSLKELAAYNVGALKPGTSYAAQFPEQAARETERIPRLADLFELVRRRGDVNVRFNIETKLTPDHPEDTVSPATMVDELLKVIVQYGLETRVTIQSFDWRTLQIVQARRPAMPTACLTARLPNFNTVAPAWNAGLALEGGVPQLAKRARCAAWSPNHQDVSAGAIAEAHAQGLQVIPWTVNRAEDIERMIALGVDGLITDRPDIARAILAARNINPR